VLRPPTLAPFGAEAGEDAGTGTGTGKRLLSGHLVRAFDEASALH
jgi:hypothetical protein